MAETKSVATDGEDHLLAWPKKDNRHFLRAVYRVGDLDRTIKYIFFNLTLNLCLLSFFMAMHFLSSDSTLNALE